MGVEKSSWISVNDKTPDNQDVMKSRRRYIAYSPRYDGYVFRCWYKDGFGAVYAESMISDVTHYRLAKKSEVDHQLSETELSLIF